MKSIKILLFLLNSIMILCILNCSKISDKSTKEKINENTTQIENIAEKKSTGVEKTDLNVILSEDKNALKKYYDLPHIKEYYNWINMSYTPQPDITYPNDLSKISYDDLRLLRNEIFARNGYLFKDGFLRGYFNRFKWYMPIFDVDTFKITLNRHEMDLVTSLLSEENRRKEEKIFSLNNLKLYNANLVVNYKQFVNVPSEVKDDLKKQNFSIVASKRAMPFYVYDNNAYEYIPHYITTDLYLYILHKYFSCFLEKLDEYFMYNHLIELLNNTTIKLSAIKYANDDSTLKSAVEWAQMYVTLALYAAGDSIINPPDRFKMIFKSEKLNIAKIEGPPKFIENQFVDYSELKPRGHYLKSEKLKNYFKAFKWISLNGIDLANDEQLRGMLVLAHVIKNNAELFEQYNLYINIIEKLAGEEDNLSLRDVIVTLSDEKINNAINRRQLNDIRNRLYLSTKEKIDKSFGESFQTIEKNTQRIYFISSTYSISGEIFSRLVHIDLNDSKRPFPNGLDILAVFGSQTAQNILINEYKENIKWPDYLPKLISLQKQFSAFNGWNLNYGFKGLQTALSSFTEEENYPDFMKTDAYNRKELNTALASWTHIKHDLILYQEKPFAAESGQGGGPPPPQHYSYVEPNINFWNSALELVNWLNQLSKYNPTFEDELNRIEELGIKLKNVASKQINGEEITDKEFDDLHYIGGTIEYIVLGLLETDHLPDRESSMALIADVYIYNGTNLDVAVGHADDINVIVPIKGEYLISRGAIFSYYEFLGKIYNDEEWKDIIRNKKEPDRPDWMKRIINNIPTLESQMQYR